MTLSFNQLLSLASATPPEERDGYRIYQGFTHRNPDEIRKLIPDRFYKVEDWCYGNLRAVWISKRHLSIFSYCEGDINLEIFDDIKVFNEQLQKSANSTGSTD